MERDVGMEETAVKQEAYEESVLAHPWIRYFARVLDLSLYSMLWMFVQRILLRWHIGGGLGQNLVDIIAALALMLLFEPLFLHFFGTTPGKWVFGLTIRMEDGEKLEYRIAFLRTLEVWQSGMGFSIPIYNLVRFYRSYSQCKRGEPLLWDEGLQYRIRDTKGWRIALCIGANVLLIALGVLILLEAQLPPHRGNLTPSQYAQNVNDTKMRLGYRDGRYLKETGEWAEKESDGTTVYFQVSEPLKHELILENGAVVGVRLHAASNEEWLEAYSDDKMLAAISFLAAQPGMSGVRLSTDPVFRKLDDELNSYSFEVANVRVTNTVEQNGYAQIGSGYLLADGLQEGGRFYNMSFEMVRQDAKAVQ